MWEQQQNWQAMFNLSPRTKHVALGSALIIAMLKAHLKHMCSHEQDLPTKASTVAAVNVNQYCLLKNAQKASEQWRYGNKARWPFLSPSGWLQDKRGDVTVVLSSSQNWKTVSSP